MDQPAPRPHLAPGLRVVRRGLDHLQVGLYDARRVLLPRTAAVEHTLGLILQRQPLEGDPAGVVDRLDRHGCLVWEQPFPPTTGTVAVAGRLDGPGLPDVGDLLAASGIATTRRPDDADVVIVLSVGELPRERLDPLLRSRTSHVVVRLVDGAAVIGPFVVPGATACLRCIDAHESVRDPDHVAVTTRYADASSRPRADGVPDLVEPALAAVALAWVVRDVVAHLGGREPATWSRTLFLGPQPAVRSEQPWLRHPGCGCCWGAS
ncbi:MAG TPA: TOMM precursor leader peptide-binding protein [Propionicimonas sp.]|nr:TOMM precursor leader peptide-binding protein [Propionicimonas sp.]